MEIITTHTNVYPFSELSEDAKERAIQQQTEYADADFFSNDSEFVIYDIKNTGKLLGFDIDNVYFSGFNSQGDGACCEGSYSYRKKSVEIIKAEYPQDDELHQIVKAFADLQKRNFYGLTADIKHRGHHYHELCTAIDVSHNDDREISLNDEDELCELLYDFMIWGYKRLNDDYDYRLNEEGLIDTIEANEYIFTADGQLF